MRVLICLIFISLSFSACGKLATGQGANNRVQVRSATREGMTQVQGIYESACAEWKGGDYQTDAEHPVYALAHFEFDSDQGYSQNISFFREADCRIPLSQLKTSGSLAFQEGNSLLYFKHHYSQFRVFGEAQVIAYQDHNFCNRGDWVNGVWREIYGKCLFGIQSVYALGVISNESSFNLYPCDDPTRKGVYCPELKLLKRAK